MIYLYGAVDDAERALDAAGAEHPGTGDNDDFRVLWARHVACVAQVTETPDQSAGPAALVAHDRVVRRVMSVATVVPFRFGTTVSDEDEFHRQLDARAAEFDGLLLWLRGRQELAVRARAAATDVPRCARTGREYLRRLAGGPGAATWDELHRVLAAGAADARPDADGEGGLKASYLVEGARVEEFCRRAVEAQRRWPHIQMSVTGPWAPYSFVTMAGGPSRPVASQGRVDA